MSLRKRFVKKLFMQFGKRWKFKSSSTTSGDLTKLCSDFRTGVQNRDIYKRSIHSGAVVFRSHDIDVKAQVLTYNKLCFFQCLIKPVKNNFQRFSLFLCQFRGNSVD